MHTELVVERALQRVENRMRALSGPGSVVHRPLVDHLASGGRRSRARLSLAASAALGLDEGGAVAAAAGCELLHNASLIHDDIQDNDTMRRETPSLWAIHGRDVAICAGDQMISAAYAAFAGVGPTCGRLIEMAHARVTEMIDGQIRDLAAVGETALTIDEYESIAAGKSGPLLALALEAPLLIAGRDEALDQAGACCRSFALAYQIVDDLADIGQDRTNGRALNMVLLLEGQGRSEGDAVEMTRQAARDHLEAARDGAGLLPQGAGALLQGYATQMIGRLGDHHNHALTA